MLQEALHAPSTLMRIMGETAQHFCHSRDFRVNCALGTVTILVGGLFGYTLARYYNPDYKPHRRTFAQIMALDTIQAVAYGLLLKSQPLLASGLIFNQIIEIGKLLKWKYRLGWLAIVILGTLVRTTPLEVAKAEKRSVIQRCLVGCISALSFMIIAKLRVWIHYHVFRANLSHLSSRKIKKLQSDDFFQHYVAVADLMARGILLAQHPLVSILYLLNYPIGRDVKEHYGKNKANNKVFIPFEILLPTAIVMGTAVYNSS